MLLTEIKREAVVLPMEATSDVAILAADAETVLGYSVLRQNFEEPTETPQLLKALGELSIEILNRADVEAYMRERLCERTLDLLADWQKTDIEPLRSWQSFSGPHWEATPINKYKEAIPEFVINKAVQIKRALPGVQIFVRHLTEDKDPFLEVTLGKIDEWNEKNWERYFIEVWDEPKFEGRVR